MVGFVSYTWDGLRMIIDVICNKCKKVIKTITKEVMNYHSKDHCEGCKTMERMKGEKKKAFAKRERRFRTGATRGGRPVIGVRPL